MPLLSPKKKNVQNSTSFALSILFVALWDFFYFFIMTLSDLLVKIDSMDTTYYL